MSNTAIVEKKPDEKPVLKLVDELGAAALIIDQVLKRTDFDHVQMQYPAQCLYDLCNAWHKVENAVKLMTRIVNKDANGLKLSFTHHTDEIPF